jgi:hypothetical protein
MSEELQRYQKKRGKKIYYGGDKLGKFNHFILGNTTLTQLQRGGIIEGFITLTSSNHRAHILPNYPIKSDISI